MQAVRELGIGSAVATAQGILEVANTVMARALRVVSAERGFDPADFTLVPFGGAGPLHACELAQTLGIRRILVPRFPGILSALGAVWADSVRDYSASLGVSFAPNSEVETISSLLHSRLAALETRASAEATGSAEQTQAVDMRYAGQGYELTVPWDGEELPQLIDAFHTQHQRLFGHSDASRAVDLVTLRLRIRVVSQAPEERPIDAGTPDAEHARVDSRRVRFERQRDVPVYDRELMRAGNRIAGPAIVSQMDSTTLVLPGWQVQVNAWGDLILEAGQR
jgi:N-methylhydantoinase A